MCVICNAIHDGPDCDPTAGDVFLGEFAAAQRRMQAATAAMLHLSKTCAPQHRQRYDRTHKAMLRAMRQWNCIEHSRELPEPSKEEQRAAQYRNEGYDVICDRRDLFDFLRAAWREGWHHGGEIDSAERWHLSTDHATKAIKGWATLRPVPSNGEQLGIPTSCGKPLCSENEHHPLCELAPR